MIEHKDCWELLDKKIQREILWIHQRMNWLLTFQGLLFTAFGLLYQKKTGTDADKEIIVYITLLSFVGIAMCICIAAGLKGSSKAIAAIQIEWESLFPSNDERNKLPSLRSAKTHRALGLTSTWGPLVLFIITWLTISIAIHHY